MTEVWYLTAGSMIVISHMVSGIIGGFVLLIGIVILIDTWRRDEHNRR